MRYQVLRRSGSSSTDARYLQARRECQLAAIVPSLETVTYEPESARGRPDTGPPRRLARNPCARSGSPLRGGAGRVRSNRDNSRWRKQSWLGRFVSTYGWRAYALPAQLRPSPRGKCGSLPDRDRDGRIALLPGPGAGDPRRENRGGGAGDPSMLRPRSLTQFDAAACPPRMLPNGGSIRPKRATSSSAASSRAARRRSARAPSKVLQMRRRGRKRHGSHRVRW